jgi:hypothetical protein
MEERGIPSKYYGWWRIIETSQWDNDDIDIIGKAMISITGHEDRLRMFVLLAYVNCKVTKTGISFTWKGAWEYDPVRECETPKGWTPLRENQAQEW